MPAHNSLNQRPSQVNLDRRRNTELRALQGAIQLALAKMVNPDHGQMHLTGKTVDMSASLQGVGGVAV